MRKRYGLVLHIMKTRVTVAMVLLAAVAQAAELPSKTDISLLE